MMKFQLTDPFSISVARAYKQAMLARFPYQPDRVDLREDNTIMVAPGEATSILARLYLATEEPAESTNIDKYIYVANEAAAEHLSNALVDLYPGCKITELPHERHVSPILRLTCKGNPKLLEAFGFHTKDA